VFEQVYNEKMIDILSNNLKKAWQQIQGWATLISERVSTEFAAIRLIQDAKRIDGSIEEIYKRIGRRVFELKERQERNILKDEEIAEALAEIQRLLLEKETLLKRASEILEIKKEN